MDQRISLVAVDFAADTPDIESMMLVVGSKWRSRHAATACFVDHASFEQDTQAAESRQHVWDLHFDPTTNISTSMSGVFRRKVDGHRLIR